MKKMALNSIFATFIIMFSRFDHMVQTLVILVIIDYITGIMAAVTKKTLNSSVGFVGIARKITIFTLVFMAWYIDTKLNLNAIYPIVTAFYIANEGISVVENASRVGVPIPEALKEIFEQIKERK